MKLNLIVEMNDLLPNNTTTFIYLIIKFTRKDIEVKYQTNS